MRQVGDRLHGPLEGGALNLVEDQGQDDGCRETEDELQHADDDGVAEQPDEIRVFEELAKVVEAVPWTAQYALGVSVVHERDADSVDGDVAKDDQDHQRREEQQVERVHALRSPPLLVPQGGFVCLLDPSRPGDHFRILPRVLPGGGRRERPSAAAKRLHASGSGRRLSISAAPPNRLSTGLTPAFLRTRGSAARAATRRRRSAAARAGRRR